MCSVCSYSVAGFGFCIDGAPFEPSNLQPFRVKDITGETLFCLHVVPSLPSSEIQPLYKTADGPDFPEITIWTRAEGYRLQLRPLPSLPVAAMLDVSAGWKEAWLQLEGTDDAFGMNNALMLLFAFASAHKGVLEMHSSVVMQGGKGFLFLGRSGTGKSTHSRLWLQHIPGSELLNDDNPILRLMPDGSARVYGSPWSGKTPCYKAQDVPVGAVVRLSQAPENRIVRIPVVQAYASLMASASAFRPLRELADGWHRTLEGLAATVPCYHLDCLPDRAAAELCYKTIYD
ncbi:MAG: hypothetical protein J5669_07565 [Bacteroidales bacterium]|nr:hypothetical protein [Bacteroidales bacterium]